MRICHAATACARTGLTSSTRLQRLSVDKGGSGGSIVGDHSKVSAGPAVSAVATLFKHRLL